MYFIGIEECFVCPDLCYAFGRNISCDCPLTDDICQLIQACESSCVNGSCYDDGMCICSTGFTGANCDTKICGSVVCNNQSICNGNYECVCPAGYIGNYCDVGEYNIILITYYLIILIFIAVCETPCLNGGTCTAPNECLCSNTYGGTFCSESKYWIFLACINH